MKYIPNNVLKIRNAVENKKEKQRKWATEITNYVLKIRSTIENRKEK